MRPRARYAAVRHVFAHHGLCERRGTMFLALDRMRRALREVAQGLRCRAGVVGCERNLKTITRLEVGIGAMV